MIDVVTNQQIRVAAPPDGNPALRLPYSQVDDVKRLLDRHGIRYWVDSHIISMSGGPYMSSIYLYRATDPAKVQAILDSVP